MLKSNSDITPDTWLMMEEIHRCNPQLVSFALFADGHDYVTEHFENDLGLKNYPPQEILFFFKQGTLYLCYKLAAFQKLSDKMLDKTVNNPSWADMINQEMRHRSDDLTSLSVKVMKQPLDKLNNNALAKLYDELYSKFRRMHISGWHGNLVEFEGALTSCLENYLQTAIEKAHMDWPTSQVLQLLTQSQETSLSIQEENDRTKIIEVITNSPKTLHLFRSSDSASIAKQLPQVDSNVYHLLSEHTSRYGWLSYQFEGPGWNKDDFIMMIRDQIARENERDTIRLEDSTVENDNMPPVSKMLATLNIDQKYRHLLDVFRDIVHFKGYRKYSLFYGCAARDHILQEVSKRIDIPIKYLRYVYPFEMKEVILGKKPELKFLEERFACTCYLYQRGVGGKILNGDEAQQFYNSRTWLNDRDADDDNIKEFKGMCASVGHAKGRVAVVNVPEDTKKVQVGDILVSEATNPDLMPAIRKSSAIVTNVGGMVCHAAIVARELKIPCVVGTKIATKALKDGDMVEVNADKGIIRKLGD